MMKELLGWVVFGVLVGVALGWVWRTTRGVRWLTRGTHPSLLFLCEPLSHVFAVKRVKKGIYALVEGKDSRDGRGVHPMQIFASSEHLDNFAPGRKKHAGLLLSTLISNHTAPVLCVSILMPIIRDFGVDSRWVGHSKQQEVLRCCCVYSSLSVRSFCLPRFAAFSSSTCMRGVMSLR